MRHLLGLWYQAGWLLKPTQKRTEVFYSKENNRFLLDDLLLKLPTDTHQGGVL